MTATATLERLARRCLPAPAARLAKRIAVHPRYRRQARACRAGHRRYASRYPHPILFIAGLPKSGTTWLERMVSSYPGFHDLLIPDVAAHELATGGSHDYELPDDMFSRFEGMLVLTKMHVHGSVHNAQLLARSGTPYVVLHRDLRDVAVSNYFYVRRTNWHPEYPHYADRSIEEGLRIFAERTLVAYAEWVRSWHRNLDPTLGLMLRYEDLLADTAGNMTEVAGHFGLDGSPDRIEEIVRAHDFRRLSAGRDRGQERSGSFFRKGVAGDWRNHFTPELSEQVKGMIGDFLIEFGYETDRSW